jgi:hypothetical protein
VAVWGTSGHARRGWAAAQVAAVAAVVVGAAVSVALPAAGRVRSGPGAVAVTSRVAPARRHDQRLTPPSVLPGDALRAAVARDLGAVQPRFFVRRTATAFQARSGRLHSTFTRGSATVESNGIRWRLPWVGGTGGTERAEISGQARNRVGRRAGALTEWYASGALGLEQGFTLTQPVARLMRGRELRLPVAALPAGTSLRIARTGRGAGIVRDGQVVLRYSDLSATDRDGRSLAASIIAGGGGRQLGIEVDARGARYPITVDPLIQVAKLTSGDTGGELGAGALAISGDVVAAGAPDATDGGNGPNGAVYVFVKPSGGWANLTSYTAKLTNGNANFDGLGQSVAISGDTIVAGAHGSGYADVFVKPSTGWTSTAAPTAVLTDSSIGGDTGFGHAVAVSGDTVAVGDPSNAGATGLVDVFVKPTTGWASTTTPTVTLTDSTMFQGAPIEATLGESVAIGCATLANCDAAGGGQAVIAGAPTWRPSTEVPQTGAALVFAEPTGGWGASGSTGHQVAILTPSAPSFLGDPGLGTSVAISGPAAIVGADAWQNPATSATTGAAYVYEEPAGGWSNENQTAVLTPSDPVSAEHFGSSVGISGETAVVGAPFAGGSDQGAGYLFREPAGGWTDGTETQEVMPADPIVNGTFGDAVAIDGATVTAAEPDSAGALYVFADAPLSISTTSLSSATAGTAYATAVAGSGGTAPYAWSATGLPAGLSINALTGAITGTPTAAGGFSPTITLTDAYGESASQQFGLTVFAAPATTSGSGIVNQSLPTITGPLRISGKLHVGHLHDDSTLTCNPGNWSPSSVTLASTWYRQDVGAAPSTTGLPKLGLKSKVLGKKPTANTKLNIGRKLVLPHWVAVASGHTFYVATLVDPSTLYCGVMASAGSARPVTANSVPVTINPDAPSVTSPPRRPRKPVPPSINPKVAVPGTNSCEPGLWTGTPTFAYRWYTSAQATGPKKLVGKQQALVLTAAEEGLSLACQVTATNRWGSTTALSNSYKVNVGAPVSTGAPDVIVTTSSPASSSTVGPAGAEVDAEVVDLGCTDGAWNRGDLSFKTAWVPTYPNAASGTVAGSTLDINMRAGQLEYYGLTVHCEVTATTPHGVAAVADSGPIEVSSGCEEWYADVLQKDTIDAHIGGPQRWLYATDPDQLFDYDEAGGPVVTGLFGLQGGGVAIDGPDGNYERASRAETDGPNCADYQKYLRGQGYDVKQGPNPDGDMFWIEHGNAFF